MYLANWVLPSSTTSGTSVPASDASSLVSTLAHCWYSTLTWAPVAAVNRLLASSTTPFQPLWASTMSQTLTVLPWPLTAPVADAASGVLSEPHAATPSSVAASAAATAI